MKVLTSSERTEAHLIKKYIPGYKYIIQEYMDDKNQATTSNVILYLNSTI